MVRKKILGLLIASSMVATIAPTLMHQQGGKNTVLLAQHQENNSDMNFSGKIMAVKIAPDMNTNEFLATPGFNQDGFASKVNEDLYNAEKSLSSDAKFMKEATALHGGNPVDTCVFFQSSALRSIGQNVPDSIGYTTHLENWLMQNGWTQHTDFQYLQKGDICFGATCC